MNWKTNENDDDDGTNNDEDENFDRDSIHFTPDPNNPGEETDKNQSSVAVRPLDIFRIYSCKSPQQT